MLPFGAVIWWLGLPFIVTRFEWLKSYESIFQIPLIIVPFHLWLREIVLKRGKVYKSFVQNSTHMQQTMKKVDQRHVRGFSSGCSSKLDEEMFPIEIWKLNKNGLRSRINHGWHFSKSDPNQTPNGVPKNGTLQQYGAALILAILFVKNVQVKRKYQQQTTS